MNRRVWKALVPVILSLWLSGCAVVIRPRCMETSPNPSQCLKWELTNGKAW